MTEDRLQPGTVPTKRHWYEIWIHRCPVCGHENEYRERRVTPRPPDWAGRHHLEEMYDWCVG